MSSDLTNGLSQSLQFASVSNEKKVWTLIGQTHHRTRPFGPSHQGKTKAASSHPVQPSAV